MGVGDRVTSLKEDRAELAGLIATALDVAAAPLGGNVNPPCVFVQPSEPYLEPATYDTERAFYDLYVVAPPGEPAAVMDALDDLVDGVRAALRKTGYAFGSVGAPALFNDLPACVVRVTHERICD